MFNKFLLVILLFALLNACKKDNPQPQVIVTSSAYRTNSVSPNYVSFDSVSIYPNPSNNIAYVNFQAAETTNCTIRIVAGKNSSEVYNENVNAGSNNIQLQLQGYSPGVVIIQVVLNSKLWEYNLIIQ